MNRRFSCRNFRTVDRVNARVSSMNKRSAALFCLALVVVFAARMLTSFQLFATFGESVSSTGDHVIAKGFFQYNTVVYFKDRSAGRIRKVVSDRSLLLSVHFDERNGHVITVGQRQITAFTPFATNSVVWQVSHPFLSIDAVMYSDPMKCVVLVGSNLKSTSAQDRRIVHVYDTLDGKLMHECYGPRFGSVRVGGDKVLIQKDVESELLMRDPDSAGMIESRTPGPLPMTVGAWPSDSPSWIETGEPPLTPNRPHLLSQPPWCLGAAFVLAVLTCVWTVLLFYPQPGVAVWWCGYWNIATLFAMLYLVGSPIGTPLFDVSGGPIRDTLPRYLMLGGGQAIGFVLLLKMNQQRQFWIATFVACMMPILIPTMLLAVFLRRKELMNYSQRHRGALKRFGIREMLLATVAIAILMQIGSLSLPIMLISIPIAFHILVSRLVVQDYQMAWGVLVICVGVISWILIAQQHLGGMQLALGQLVYLLIVPMSFAVLQVCDLIPTVDTD